jgi:Ni,Fe-hydrogenase III small subunit/ferredoxin-like protein FixX
MLKELQIWYHQGSQFIRDVKNTEVPGIFKGRPVISEIKVDEAALVDVCPTRAINPDPVSIDLGRCTFCGICAFLFPDKIWFTKDYHLSANNRIDLAIRAGKDLPIKIRENEVRPEIRKLFRKSLKLRQVSAGGDNSAEMELNATGNVQFDIGRFGIEFVASPRHADGLVITGPITKNMARALEICYHDTPSPKIVVLCGTDAISGGIFSDSPAIDRSFLEKTHIDLYIPGNPPHPLTIINGLLDLLGK